MSPFNSSDNVCCDNFSSKMTLTNLPKLWRWVFSENPMKGVLKKGRKEKVMNVWVAKTTLQQMVGFMFRPPPREDEAVLFVFKNTSKHCVWSAFVRFPLKVLFLSENLTVLKEDYLYPFFSPFKGPHRVCSLSSYVLEIHPDKDVWRGGVLELERDI